MEHQETAPQNSDRARAWPYMAGAALWLAVGQWALPALLPQASSMLPVLQTAWPYALIGVAGVWGLGRLRRARHQQCQWHARAEQLAHRLAERDQHLQLVLGGVVHGTWQWDLATHRPDFSAGMASLLGACSAQVASEQLSGFRYARHVQVADRRQVHQALRATLRDGAPLQLTVLVRGLDGQDRWLEIRGQRHLNGEGQSVRLAGVATDHTLRRREENRLRLAASVVHNTREGIVVTGPDSRILSVNGALTNLLGYEEAELLGKTPAVFKSGRHDRAFYAAMWDDIGSTGHWRGEIWNKRKNGEIFPERMSLSAVKDNQGQVTHYVCMFTDISEEKAREQQLEFVAHRDALTGLANRAGLVRKLDSLVESAARSGEQLAVILLNLDRFKDVNDSYGHAVGDEVLKHIAAQLQGALRTHDLIGRMAGDEMVVVARHLQSPQDAAEIAGRLIEAAAQPWESPDGFAVVVAASAGICSYPQHGNTAAGLLQGAHAAVYGAKQGRDGGNPWCFFHEDMTLAARERIALEARLRHAVQAGHLRLFYQPQVDIATGRMVGAEALVRWMDPEEGMISPVRFIPVAETSGLIGPLGEWVLGEACRQANAWRVQGLPEISMAVNVSLRQFLLTDITACTQLALERSGLPARLLELEITESALAERPDEALVVLRSLKALGLRLAIDDFGTGYSSLAHLKRFPIDLLKIDKGFIRDIPRSADDMAISRAVIAMGQSMGLQVLAEGVETPEQLAFLRQHGCNYFQGYYYSKPVPAEEFEALLRTQVPSLAPAAVTAPPSVEQTVSTT